MQAEFVLTPHVVYNSDEFSSLYETWASSQFYLLLFHPFQEGLDLWLQPYRILSTGKRTGLIQVRVARKRLTLPAAAAAVAAAGRGGGFCVVARIAADSVVETSYNDWNEIILEDLIPSNIYENIPYIFPSSWRILYLLQAARKRCVAADSPSNFSKPRIFNFNPDTISFA